MFFIAIHVYVGILGTIKCGKCGLNKNVLDFVRGNKVQPLEINNTQQFRSLGKCEACCYGEGVH